MSSLIPTDEDDQLYPQMEVVIMIHIIIIIINTGKEGQDKKMILINPPPHMLSTTLSINQKSQFSNLSQSSEFLLHLNKTQS